MNPCPRRSSGTKPNPRELVRISHRILVMRKGKIVKELAEGAVTQADILEAASGIGDEEVAV